MKETVFDIERLCPVKSLFKTFEYLLYGPQRRIFRSSSTENMFIAETTSNIQCFLSKLAENRTIERFDILDRRVDGHREVPGLCVIFDIVIRFSIMETSKFRLIIPVILSSSPRHISEMYGNLYLANIVPSDMADRRPQLTNYKEY